MMRSSTSPGIIVADIAAGTRSYRFDGSISLTIEALTVVED
jgi:hypothetical protein